MSLTAEQKEKIIKNFSKIFENGCSICKSNNLDLQDELAIYFLYDSEYKTPIEGTGIPVVLFTCKNCAHVMTFKAEQLGLI